MYVQKKKMLITKINQTIINLYHTFENNPETKINSEDVMCQGVLLGYFGELCYTLCMCDLDLQNSEINAEMQYKIFI